jgi:hypothetical protein
MSLTWSPDYAPVDGDFADVSLLLLGEGTNGSTTILDSSSNNLSVTANGDAQISTAVNTPFGTGDGVLAFDGTGDYLSMPSDASFAFGTGQYTVELWAYFSVSPAFGAFFAVIGGLQFGNDSAGYISIAQQGVAFELSSTTSVPLNQWVHLAATRDASNTTRIFLNGLQIKSGTITTNYPQGTAYVNYNPFNTTISNTGYISNLRITKGVARYTENFDVPTAPFPIYSPTTRAQA